MQRGWQKVQFLQLPFGRGDNMEEEWKEIKGYPDYLISNHGRVKSFKYDKEDGRILKPHISTRGYSQVNLWDETRKRTIQ